MTINEIAKLAGVSSAAVSRYFNNGYISDEKKEAIKKIVDETGYRPSLQAQTLRTRKTKLIGVIIPKIDSSSIGRVVAGIQSVLEQRGYQILLANTQNNPDKELVYLSMFDDKQVDGVIFVATVLTAEHKRALKKMQLPVVMVGQSLDGYNCVYHDDYGAMNELTKQLIEKGRTRLGYIGALPQDKAVGEERYRGYVDAVTERGRSENAEWYEISDFSMESGYEKARALLRKHKDINGIICVTDRVAIGAIKYLKDSKIKIPQDIVVTGHGDSVMSRVVEPGLTTVHYHYEESGAKAAGILMSILENDEKAVSQIKMGYEIIESKTTEL